MSTCFVTLQLGAAFEPNPGVCSLKPGSEKGVNFEEYTDDVKYVSHI